jgi:hypothetical protein
MSYDFCAIYGIPHLVKECRTGQGELHACTILLLQRKVCCVRAMAQQCFCQSDDLHRGDCCPSHRCLLRMTVVFPGSRSWKSSAGWPTQQRLRLASGQNVHLPIRTTFLFSQCGDNSAAIRCTLGQDESDQKRVILESHLGTCFALREAPNASRATVLL